MTTGPLLAYELDNGKIYVGSKLEVGVKQFKLKKGLILDKEDCKTNDLTEWIKESYMEQMDKIDDVYFDPKKINKPHKIY